MLLKERYVIIDFLNQDLVFIGDSLKEVKEYLVINAKENDNDVEDIINLRLNKDEIYSYLRENTDWTLDWQKQEEYDVDEE
jgi:hypothetical protein